MNKKKYVLAGGFVLILILGAGWAMGFFEGTDPQIAELEKMRDENLSNRGGRPDEGFREKVRELSDEQRQQFFESSRPIFQQMMIQRMDRFFALPPEEQQQELDQWIDRMEERRQQRAADGGRGDGGNRGNQSGGDRDQRRKARLDSSTPEMRAKMDRFMDQMNDRREERGLEPVRGFRGMRGGGGGPGGRR